ncbi:MAG: hypothetical protein IT195_03975 [Microthrixaceae bacterium]|nr:hypothetical protein [Microthrixaceae bacterium]
MSTVDDGEGDEPTEAALPQLPEDPEIPLEDAIEQSAEVPDVFGEDEHPR